LIQSEIVSGKFIIIDQILSLIYPSFLNENPLMKEIVWLKIRQLGAFQVTANQLLYRQFNQKMNFLTL